MKITSNCINDLNLGAKPINFLRENTGGNLNGVRFGNDFKDMTPKYRQQKKKQISWTTSKLRIFVHQRILSRK